MRLMGWEDDPHEQVHYLAARCYPLLASGKAVQAIYRHARIRPILDDRYESNIPEAISLPDEAVARIKRTVEGRDIAGVRRELDETLEWRGPANVAEKRAFHEEFVPWILDGMDALCLGDEEGVEQFLKDVKSRLGRRRRRGGIDSERHFLNMFEYEVKTNFYLCYANAWIDLVPWLREHRGLDPVSERFLKFWHHQDQPLDGELDGIGDPRPAFSGQVLALHPASAFFMSDPALLEFAGRYFGTEAAEAVEKTGRADGIDAYWDLVRAILVSAHQYRQVDRDLAGRRGASTRTNRDEAVADRPGAAGPLEIPVDAAESLEQFLASRGDRCRCGGDLGHVRIHRDGADPGRCSVNVACRSCRGKSTLGVDDRELQEWARDRGRDD